MAQRQSGLPSDGPCRLDWENLFQSSSIPSPRVQEGKAEFQTWAHVFRNIFTWSPHTSTHLYSSALQKERGSELQREPAREPATLERLWRQSVAKTLGEEQPGQAYGVDRGLETVDRTRYEASINTGGSSSSSWATCAWTLRWTAPGNKKSILLPGEKWEQTDAILLPTLM